MLENEVEEAWRTIKGWYRAVEEKAPKPCYLTMLNQTNGHAKLYTKQTPPGDPIPVHLKAKFDVRDETPPEKEIREAVKGGRLKNNRADGASRMRAEDIKSWLKGKEEEEKDPDGHEGAGYKWDLFIKLVQSIWEEGTIPRNLMNIIIVLIPKGNGDY